MVLVCYRRPMYIRCSFSVFSNQPCESNTHQDVSIMKIYNVLLKLQHVSKLYQHHIYSTLPFARISNINSNITRTHNLKRFNVILTFDTCNMLIRIFHGNCSSYFAKRRYHILQEQRAATLPIDCTKWKISLYKGKRTIAKVRSQFSVS